MSRLIDAIASEGERWTAVCGLEVREAVRVCFTCADNPSRAGQCLAAYLLIASKRDAETLQASVSDGEAASAVPKIRGAGFVSSDTFRKQIKPLLFSFGLVSYDAGNLGKDGKTPTLYGFPMLETLLGFSGEGGQIANDLSADDKANLNPPTGGQSTNDLSTPMRTNHIQASPPTVDKPRTTCPTSRVRRADKEDMQLGIGNNNNPVSVACWTPYNPPETCPYCGAYGSTGWAMVGGVDYVYCSACDAQKLMTDWENAKYSALQASPDIPF